MIDYVLIYEHERHLWWIGAYISDCLVRSRLGFSDVSHSCEILRNIAYDSWYHYPLRMRNDIIQFLSDIRKLGK